MIKIFYWLAGGFVATLAFLLIVSRFPVAGNLQVMIVQSGSMEPAVKTGAIVVVKPAETYNVGDVITFGQTGPNQTPVTHRIVEVKNQNGAIFYATKGDANEDADMRDVWRRDVIGRVIFDVPFVGYVLATAKQPVGFLFLVIVPATIIVFDELRELFAEWKKIRERKIANESNKP